MPAGLLTSYFLYKEIRGAKIFRIIFYLPAIITPLAMVTVYKNFIHPNGVLGILANYFGKSLPPEGLLARSSSATNVIIGYSIWIGLASGM